ncbi:MAG TPA: EVE domain-containing protein, partial [Vineibacter sp.]|nr:EVE domain-containing protein [Vineibacter sp.]
TGKFGMVDVAAVKPMKTPVTLAAIKAEAKLKELALVRQGRLSVTPVPDAHWALLLKMGQTTV